MKKGLIVEHHRRYTIVLTKNGGFYKAKPMHDKEIGEDVLFDEFSPKKRALFYFPKIAMVPVVALLILLISPLYPWLANDQVYAVISIDINPSLNVKVDRNYHVVDVQANNDDGQRVLDALDLKEKSLEEITNRILLYARDNFGIEDEAPVLVAVSYMDDKEDSDSVEHVMNQQIEEIGFEGTVYQAAEEWRIKAEEENISMNAVAHETLGEISDTVEQEDSMIGEANHALISQFFNSKETSPVDEKVTDDVSELQRETENTTVEQPEEEPITSTEESENNHPKLPVQASDRAKERVSNNPAALREKSNDSDQVGHSKQQFENKKGKTDTKKDLNRRNEQHPASDKASKHIETEASYEMEQREDEPEVKQNNEEGNGLDE